MDHRPLLSSRVLANPVRLVGAVLVLLACCAAVAAAQSGFRVAHELARTTATHAEVTGTVLNETRAEALNVSVTVEAIGPGGKVVARGITFVAGRLPAGASAPFVAKVPVTSGVTGYRAAVTSFRFVPTGGESP
ncbi:MAG: hypothetical protein HYU41_19430 [Candidatus Rokubacteria bacterium]|nr:hypothetical protein [Candidatus Rokubacteria bacterium]